MKNGLLIMRIIAFVPMIIVGVDIIYAAGFWLKPESQNLPHVVGVLQVVALFIIIPLVVVFVAHVWRVTKITRAERIALTAALLLVPIVAVPIYSVRFYGKRSAEAQPT